jgi:hypothetical protein
MEVSVTIHEHAEPILVGSVAELDKVLQSAADEAHARGMLNVIFIASKDENTVSMVVGSQETVLGFTHGHNEPPYYASRGPIPDDHPVLTCFAGFTHHTEFPRRSVIPLELGIRAIHEFAESGVLPTSVAWEEV